MPRIRKQITINMDPDVFRTIQHSAQADMRSTSRFIELILIQWVAMKQAPVDQEGAI